MGWLVLKTKSFTTSTDTPYGRQRFTSSMVDGTCSTLHVGQTLTRLTKYGAIVTTSHKVQLMILWARYTFMADLNDPSDELFEVDPSYIIINDKQYLLGSYIDGIQFLYIRPMTNPYTPDGPKRLLSTPSYDWELEGGSVNEGPEPLYHDGRIFGVFSASHCSTPNYKLGLLEFVGTDPLDSTHWKKYPEPFFQRSDANHIFGPGHNGFFKSPDDTEDWIVYHANEEESQGCGMERSSRAQKFTWDADGLPVFGVPEALGDVYPGPSGE